MSYPQADAYKLDFEQERNDRGKAMGMLLKERQLHKIDVAELNESIQALQEQLKKLSMSHENEVRFKPDYFFASTYVTFVTVFWLKLCI